MLLKKIWGVLIIISIIFQYNLSAQDLKLNIENDLNKTYSEGGIEKTSEFLLMKKNENLPDSIFNSNLIIKLAVKEFKTGKRKEGLNLLEKAKAIFKDDKAIFSVLGQFYWYEWDREKCISNFEKVIQINPENKTANEYLDMLRFVPDSFIVPNELKTEHLLIRPLSLKDVELDYKAVMSSVEHLKGVFGPNTNWPDDNLTLENDRKALTNHEAEHLRRVAFTYTVMNHSETECLGCVYILPIHNKNYDAQIFMWVTSKSYEMGYDKELFESVKKWIAEDWTFNNVIYPGRDMDWFTYNKL